MDKIKNISITNFKSIKHLEINDCNKINVFIGMPNAGKSNILEALGLFGYFNNSGSLKDYVRYEFDYELFFKGITLNPITINLDKNLSLSIIDKERFNESEFLPIKGTNLKYKEDFLVDELFFHSIKKYIFDNKRSQKRGDPVLEFPFGENIGQIISMNNDLRESVSKYLYSNGLKMVIKSGTFELVLQKDLDDGTVFELPYNMIADTLQRLIFYKAAIISNKDSVLLFEEPEAHCFEPYILEFTNGVKYDENNNQFFIVTHSDYIVKEFLRDEESKENTNIYLVNNVDGETKVKLLDKKNNEDVFEFGMNIFFNFESLWETN
jgi:AAA15 family ATPase/GTPase